MPSFGEPFKAELYPQLNWPKMPEWPLGRKLTGDSRVFLSSYNDASVVSHADHLLLSAV
jgi:hypothetical protein